MTLGPGHKAGRDWLWRWRVQLAVDTVAAWLVALQGRSAYVVHALSGHAVVWRRETPDASCPGDVVCDDCGQILWCRAHDPWLAGTLDGVPDHWGARPPGLAPRPLLTVLDDVLLLADQCPRDAGGGRVRRLACELVEAVSPRERHVLRRRLLEALKRLDRTRAAGIAERDVVQRLTAIVRMELQPESWVMEGMLDRSAG